MFDILTTLLEKYNLLPEMYVSSKHLGDKASELKHEMLSMGYSDITMWYQKCNFAQMSFEHSFELFSRYPFV